MSPRSQVASCVSGAKTPSLDSSAHYRRLTAEIGIPKERLPG